MKTQYKSYGIHTPEPLEIVRIQIEQEFGKSCINSKIDLIRVLQTQAKTELKFIPGQSWPEEDTEIEEYDIPCLVPSELTNVILKSFGFDSETTKINLKQKAVKKISIRTHSLNLPT